MNGVRLKTMKEVADLLDRPSHRIIHVCESGVVQPTVDAQGRGSVRRFSRDDIFRVRLALELQDASVPLPLIKPLMRALNQFMEMDEVQAQQPNLRPFDLVSVITLYSTPENPIRAFLEPPKHVALLVPNLCLQYDHGNRPRIFSEVRHLDWPAVTIVANLSLMAEFP